MPNSIDKRIVEMQFDNSNFERNIGQSMKSLDSFKQQLDFTGYEKSFGDLERIANQVNFDNLTDSLNYLENRFSNIGIIGMTVVQNLTTAAMQSFSKVASSITGMAKTGGINRALNIENAKFQLEGLNVAWKDIEDDINYGVKDTAYGLDEAAKAASQLVASQVELGDEMKMSLRGISGVAAMTNSSYSDIAHIFTTVAGNGRLMTMQLQQLSYKGLNAAATLAEHLHVSEATLREMVTKGQVDFKTFAKAMDDAFGAHAKDANKTFTGAMSNMRAAFSRLGAKVAAPTLENIRKMVVNLIDVINDASKALDPMINDFNDFFDKIRKGVNKILTSNDFAETYRNYIDTIRFAFYDLLMILDPIKDAFRDVFPQKSLQDAKNFSKSLRDFISTFYITRENAENLRRTFRGLFSVIDIAGQVFGALIETIFGAREGIFDFGSSILEVTGDFGDYLYRLSNVLRETNYFGELFGNIKSRLEPVFYFFKGLGMTIAETFENFKFDNFDNFISKVKGSEGELSTLQIVFEGIKAVFDDLGKALAFVSPLFEGIFTLLTNSLGTFGKAIGTAFTGGGWDTFMALVNGSLITGIIYTVERIMSTINGISWKSLGILDTIRKPFLSTARAIDVFAQGLKYENLLKIAKAIGILTLSLVALSLIDADRLETSLTIVTACALELVGVFKMLTSSAKQASGGNIITDFISSIGDAAGTGANALAMSGFLISFSTGLLLMSAAVANLARFDMESLQRGLIGITALIIEVVMAANSLGKNEGDIKIAAGSMLAFAVGIAILGKVVKTLATLELDQLKVGLLGVGTLIAAIGVFVNKVDTESFKLSAISMVGFALGITMLVKSAGALSSVPFDQMMVGLGAVGAIMLAIGAFINNVDTENFKLSAISMLGFAAALAIVGNTAMQLSAIPFDQIIVGVGAVLAILLGFGAFINNVESNGLITIAAGMVIMAAAINLLTPALIKLSALTIDQLFISLGALAGTFFVFGYAAQALAPAIAIIEAFAASVLMIGLGVGAATAGITLLVNAILALGASGGLIAEGIAGLLLILSATIPQIVIILTNGVITFIKTIIEGLKEIFPPLGELIEEICVFIINKGPLIMDTLRTLVDYAIQILDEMLPGLIDSVLNAVVMLLQKLSDLSGELTRIGCQMIMNILEGLNQMLPDLIEMAFQIVVTFIDGFATALDQNSGTLTEALAHLIDSLVKAIGDLLPMFLEKGTDIIANLTKGLMDASADILKYLVDLGADMLKSIGIPEDWVDAAANLIKGFIDGIVEWGQGAIDAVANLAHDIIDTVEGIFQINSPSKLGEWWGKMIDKGFGNGLEDNKDLAVNAAEVVGDAVNDKMNEKVDNTIGDIKDKMAKFDSFLERWARNHENTIEAGRVQILSNGTVVDKDANKDKFLAKQQQLMQNRKNAGAKNIWNNTTAAVKESTDALNDETSALKKNSGAGRSNTKAKEENEKANDGKTEAIDEETESLGEEEEATNENSEAIREMAEQIEVVTEKYNELNATQGFRDKFKIARSTLLQMGEAFHTTFRSTKKDANGVETVIKKTYGEVSQIFNSTRVNTKKTTDAIKKGLYAFDAATDKYDKKLTKKLQKGKNTVKNAEKQVRKTGKTIAKVYEGYAKIFIKNGNGVEKMTVRLTKKVKNLGKFVKEASSFVKGFNTNIHEAAYVEDFTSNLRNIEKFFYKRKNMPQKVQDYLGDILSQFKGDFKDAMNILAKSIDGIGDYWNKGAQNTAYVADSMVQLAAALYDGSDAANEYWTQIARLEFLYENGEATLEELEEAKRPYLERAIEVLKEFYDTLNETIGGQFDPFSEFDKKVEDSTKNLLDAIQSQIVGFNNWGDMLVALGQRGADFNLMKQLAEQGVESYGLVENLVTMTASQLALYNKYYRMMDSVKKKATDSAIAAMANARAMASLRAASESGTLSEKQQEKQRNLAKRMTDDIKSVANAQAYYNNMTKKQERDYIKTLDKKGKAEYKAQLKAAKAAKALNDRIAAEEEAKRVEENRISTILETVKGYDSLISVINQYSNDAGVMTKINERLNNSFEQIFKYAGNDKSTMLSWLEFGKVLGVEEEDSENAESYLSSLSSALNSFIDNLKNALYDVKSLFTKFVEATEKTSADKMFTNASSVVRASRQFGDYIQKLADLGYDQKAINYFVSKFESDKANALAEMEALLNGDIKRNKVLFEYAINAGDKIKEKAMQQAARAVTESAKKDKQQAYNLAKAEAESATRILEGMQRGSSDYQNEVWNKLNDYGRNIFDREEELRNSIQNFVIESGGGVEISKLESFISESYKKYASSFAEELNNIKKIQGGSIEQRAQAIRRLLDQSPLYKEIYEAQAREYENSKRHLEESINRFHQMEISEPRNIQMEDIIRFEEATKALNKLNEEYKKSIPYIYNQAQAEVKAEFDKAKANAEAKKKTADARKKELEAIEKQLQSYQKEAEMLMTYDDALYEVQRKLKDMGETYSNFTSAIKQAGWSTEFIRKACESFRAALLPVNNALSYARHRFAEWAKGSAAVLVNLDKMDEGFLKFASTLDKTNNEAGNFMEDLGSRLEEYRKTLDSTIKGQVQLFDEFKKYSGEEATGANTYLDNMISQTEGLAQWLTNLETLAKRGVAKEVVQMFAAEGQNSFEKVEAFAKASNEQLAELNKRYKDYSKLASEAADRALAAVGAAYTAGAEAMQEKLVNSFKERAKDQIEQSAYEAATMVVTGVKNGINNARPELVAEIDGIATAITNTVGKTLTAKDIEESIRKGLVSMSGAIQNTVGVIVSDFLDSVTNTSVKKFKMAVDQCRMYVEQNLPREFTITIHVDSSEMDAAIAHMNMAINGTNVIANRTSAVVAQSQINQEDRELYPLNTAPGNVTNVNYTQNNYSPTALSRAEIYRQTQNQLSTIQGVVSAS